MKLLKRFFTSVAIVLASMIALAGCQMSTGEKPISIEMDRIMMLGEEYELNVRLLNADASLVEWNIDNPEIAKFEGDKIIPLAEGSFNLSASLGDDKDIKHIIVRNRYVYNIEYHLDGGKEDPNNPLVTKYSEGQEVLTLNAPVKYGYKFAGFYDNEELSGEAIKSVYRLKENISLYAAWEIIKYPIAYELNGGLSSVALPSIRTVEDEEFALPELTKEGYDFAGWYDNELFEGERVTHLNAENANIKNLYAKFTPTKYAIEYVLDGGENNAANPAEYEFGSELVIQTPTKKGYKFLGWTLNGEVVEKIAADQLGEITLTATWELISYSISFELNGGSVSNVLPENRTVEDAELVLPIPEKANYDFLGWFENADFSGSAVVTLNGDNLEIEKLYAQFAPKSFNISYQLNGGENAAENPDSYVYGNAVILAIPTKEHYNFVEWQLNGVAVTEISAENSGNVELVAVWELVKYTVLLDYNDGSSSVEKILSIDEFAEQIIALFNSTGKSDALVTTREDFKATTHPNIKYVWNNAENLAEYKWLFEFALAEMTANAAANGLTDHLDETVKMLNGMIAGDVNAVGGSYANGRTALRWFIEGIINKKLPTNTSIYNHLMTDFSKAENQQKFIEAQGAMPKTELTIEDTLPVITREHYTFLGWFDAEGNKVENVSGNCTLVAHWEIVKYDLTFNLNGGVFGEFNLDKFSNDLVDMFNKYGESSTLTTKENFKATSHPQIKTVWNKAETLAEYKWLFEFAIAEMTANAAANGVEGYLTETVDMLTRMANGDITAVGSSSYANARTAFRFWIEGLMNNKLCTGTGSYDNLMTDFSNETNMARFINAYSAPYLSQKLTCEDSLPAVSREGYIFKGWYANGVKVEAVTGSMSLVAEWEIIKYDISYDLNGGAWAEGQEGIVEFEYNQVVTLPTPIREGYTFLGWTQFSQYVNTIENTDYILVAKWKDNTQTGYEVIFDLNGGSWEDNLDTFAEELVALFNSTGASDAKVTTRENFKNTSHPNIKYVWNNTENLAKYKWLFEFAIAEMTANAAANGVEGYLTETVDMLTRMANGDTTAVGSSSYANARTAFRFWIEGLMNNKLCTGTGSYDNLMTDFSLLANQAKFIDLYCPLERTIEPKQELPVPVRENYIFLGWTLDGAVVEYATGDDVLVATWIHEDDYEWTVDFDLAGGEWPGAKTIDDFGKEIVALFNSTGKSDALTTTIESFKATSHPNIKYVWNNAENLAKYKWLFEFAIAEMTANAAANGVKGYLTETVDMLTRMANGDTTAVGSSSYANARTAFRFWIEGLINNKLCTGTGSYDNLMTDFSNVEKQAEFLSIYNAINTKYTAKDALPTPVKEGNIFLGWLHDGQIVEQVRGNWTLVASWLDTATIKYQISYDLNGGAWAEGETPVTEFGYNGSVSFLTPVKEGYNFLGWFEGNAQVLEVTNKDYALVAKWEEIINEDEVKTLYVDPSNPDCYASFEDALSAAKAGDTIILCAGTYTSIEITKGIKLYGPNASINPNNAERLEEAVFTSDIIISASNVTIDGIKLTENGRIKSNGNLSFSNLTIMNVFVENSTCNPGTTSNNAPIYISSSTSGVVYENILLINLKYEGGSGRPMALYLDQVENIKVLDSVFKAIRSSFNDAVKIGNEDHSEFGVRGNVTFQGCHFENYAQYVIWLLSYAEGNYNILNNTFLNCGQTAASHCALRFGSYVGEETGLVNIKFNYNEVNNSYSLIRFANTSRTETNLLVEVHYNKLYNCSATYYVNNELSFEIDATNNWYDTTPVASKFLNAKWNPYIENEADIPEFVDVENSILINYDLAEGTLPENAIEYYNKLTGLSILPTPSRTNHVFIGWSFNGEIVTSLPKGLEGEINLVANWREDAIYVGESDADYVYQTIAEALAVATDGSKIILLPGTYNESFTISVPNLTIVGPNQGLNDSAATRSAEAILTGTITIDAAATGLTIDGLAFTGAAKIKGKQVKNLLFVNNYAYDTDEAANAWAETNGYKYGFIYISSDSNSSASEKLQFHHNVFSNVSDANVNISYVKDVTFNDNVFKNFDRDAIRFNNGGYNYGLLSFTNNEFVQDSMGGYNGIYFRIYGGGTGSECRIIIDNNYFKNIGNASAGLYSGAISARNYQEKGAYIDITNNIFEGCLNYIRIRNNGTATNHASTVWACNVENNEFLGLPTTNYFAVWNASDSDPAQNPIVAVFGANYYEDNSGNVISDLSAHEDLFKQVADKGSALTAKPAHTEAKPLEFYSISYELNGGSTYETFTYEYNSFLTEAITLPTLSKVNHNFLGWNYNGSIVTEIPADARGNLVLVAEFQVLEGDFYNVTFVTEKGNFPTRDAVSREEIIAELLNDLYEWQVELGTTKTFEEYKTWVSTQLAAYASINLRNNELGNYPAEDGSTEFFFNIPKYYEKWNAFFALFNEAMLAVNSGQSFYKDDYATNVRLNQFFTWSSTGQGYFGSYLTKMYQAVQIDKEIMTQYQGGQIAELPVLTHNKGLEFLGWYLDADFSGEPVTHITATDTGDKVFYAKWSPEIKPETIQVNNPSTLERYAEFQLVWSLSPDNVTDPSVEFFSSNPEVASITPLKGLITAHKNGTTTITIKVYGNREIDYTFDLIVYSPGHFEASYETDSFVNVDGTIKLNANYIDAEVTEPSYVWTTANDSIATVENGVVTGVASGETTIRCALTSDETVYIEFKVTVLGSETSELLDFILNNHESNVFTKWNLGIGAGVPVYYSDIVGSVNRILFNTPLEISDEYYKDNQDALVNGDTFGVMDSIEFITVHYTGNMSAGADAAANANYFTGLNGSDNVSIHYTTGNDGVFRCLADEYSAWHAGDSGALEHVGEFEWLPTGVAYDGTDLLEVQWSASDDFYFEINGKKTSIALPATYDYSSRGTDHIANADGTYSSQSDFGQTGFTGRTPESFFNNQGFGVKVVDGEYYMGKTWWCYTQFYEGRICSTGGNRNSIGMESCVDKGSDLWLTWQKTAQLVASLMVEHGLGIERVKGHHFYSGKDCPQPLLENDCEIWKEFIKLVEAEYELLTKFADAKITVVSNNPDIVDDNGRVIKVPKFTTCVSYTVTIELNGETETITLSSMIPGIYEKQ